MRELADFHHFRCGEIPVDDMVARCEQWVVQTLLESELGDDRRDSSVAFELKHHHSVGQFARVLARKRGLPVEPCTVGALLHDVYVIVEGGYADHAHRGAPIALATIDAIGGFSEEERSMVERIVYHHSDKHLWSEDPFVEFGKDVDVLDCFLYPGAFGYYLRHKQLAVFAHYLRRADLVWDELGMPKDPRFRMLDDYGPSWLGESRALGHQDAVASVAGMLAEDHGFAPPFFLKITGEEVAIATRPGAGGDPGEPAGPRTPLGRQADDLIVLSERRGAGLLVFPALGSFEIVEDDSARVEELGLEDLAAR